MAFQQATLTGTTGTGYAVPFTNASNGTKVTCKTAGADFWIKAILQGNSVNAPGGTPAAAGLVSGWSRLITGDSVNFGIDPNEARGGDPVVGFSVWCVTAGELDFLGH